MKKLLWISIAIAVLLNIAALNKALSATLRWDASSSGNVVGYIIYYHEISGVVPPPIDYKDWQYRKIIENIVEYPTENLQLIFGKTYAICVVAYNNTGQSTASNTVQYTVPVFEPPDDILPILNFEFEGVLTIEGQQVF